MSEPDAHRSSKASVETDRNGPSTTCLVNERRVVWKLDACLIPITTLFYLLSFLDRANIGNARIAGLQKDLGLTDRQYKICITVLYIPYIIAELPANLLLRKVGANLLMPSILTTWGIICALQGIVVSSDNASVFQSTGQIIAQGTVTSFAGLVTVRAFLGLCEGPMFPAIVLYLSGFYTRRELSLRISLFFSAASLSGAFSGLLAAAIENMDGIGGRPGWAWIFIIEGLFTVVVGFSGFFLIPATPDTVRFLNAEEKSIINKRLHLDRPSSMSIDKFSVLEVFRSISSPHVMILLPTFFFAGTTLYGLALFLPTIVNQLGYNSTRAQLISVGPFAAGFIFSLIVSYYSDRYQRRSIPTCICAGIATIGFVLFLCSSSNAMSYGSLFLSVSGTYALAPINSTWMANNSEPHYRRATSIALAYVATNVGGILSTWNFPDSERPRFVRATIINITFSALVIVFSIINVIYLTWKTRQKRLHRTDILEPYISAGGSASDGGERAWADLGDKHPDLHYSL